MGGFGWHNPWPFEFGGGETAVERVYAALRSAVGKGGSAEDESTIDALWRQARALGIAAVATFGERSALQAFPNRATDLLLYYESLFLLTNNPAQTDQERRDIAAVRYVQQLAGSMPDTLAALQLIDSRFTLESTSADASETTVLGRAFQDYDGDEPFNGGRKSTRFANYSSDFVLYATLEIGSAVLPTPAEQRSLAAARALLNEVLPAWNSFELASHRGFELDVDRLDLTAFDV